MGLLGPRLGSSVRVTVVTQDKTGATGVEIPYPPHPPPPSSDVYRLTIGLGEAKILIPCPLFALVVITGVYLDTE